MLWLNTPFAVTTRHGKLTRGYRAGDFMKKVIMAVALAGLLAGCATSDDDYMGSTAAQSGRGTTSGTGSRSLPGSSTESGVIRSDGTGPSGKPARKSDPNWI